jgi:hypothetical protein
MLVSPETSHPFIESGRRRNNNNNHNHLLPWKQRRHVLLADYEK